MIYFTSTRRYNLEEKLSNYFKVGGEYVSKISDTGLVVFDAVYQPPLLVEPEKGIGRKDFLRRISNVRYIPNAYYGIGGQDVPYRCLLIPLALKKYSERIREMIGSTPRGIIFDAFIYDFVNSFRYWGTNELGVNPDSPDIAYWILDQLIEKSKDYEVRKVLTTKDWTFRAMSKMVGFDTTYISAVDFFGNPFYRETLRKLLDDTDKEYVRWTALVPNPELGSLDYLYVPMEISEALTLLELGGVGVKIGDPKERGFDQLIAKRSDRYLFTYTMPAVTPGGNRPPYRNQYDIDFCMNESEVIDFLKTSPADVLRQFEFILISLGRLQPTLERRAEEVIKGTIEVFSEIKGEIDEKI